MVELRFLRKPEKMDNTLRLFFLLSDWAWWRDDSWLKGWERGGEMREVIGADNKWVDIKRGIYSRVRGTSFWWGYTSHHWLTESNVNSWLQHMCYRLCLSSSSFCHMLNNYSAAVVGNEIPVHSCHANETFDNNRLHSGWVCADGLIYLTEGIVSAPSVNLFLAHTVSLTTVWVVWVVILHHQNFWAMCYFLIISLNIFKQWCSQIK